MIPTLADIREAAARIAPHAIRTPLVRLAGSDGSPNEIYLKLENLQPFGSYKIRGVANAVLGGPPPSALVTASAGNMAQSVAFFARQLGIPCTALVPRTAPAVKREAIARLGARLVELEFPRVWELVRQGGAADFPGYFVHPAFDRRLNAGHGTVALEIVEALPALDTLIVPFGVGGLTIGTIAAARALRPGLRILACEVETAAPLTASFSAGRAVAVDRRPSFVDAIGTPEVLPGVFEAVRAAIDGTIVVPVAAVTRAARDLLHQNHVVVEGAAAATVAAARSLAARGERIACIISGGNLPVEVLREIA